MKTNPSFKVGLESMGFKALGTVGELQQTGILKDTLQSPGVYAITCSKGFEHSFIPLEETRTLNNVIHPWTHEKLEAKWVDGVETLYFGKAQEQSLNRRLSQLLRHSLGLTTKKGPHNGGEIIWQLKGYESFHILYLPAETPVQAAKIENDLISEFRIINGKLPFGNRNEPGRQR